MERIDGRGRYGELLECPYCGKEIRAKHRLDRHIKDRHPGISDKGVELPVEYVEMGEELGDETITEPDDVELSENMGEEKGESGFWAIVGISALTMVLICLALLRRSGKTSRGSPEKGNYLEGIWPLR